MLRFFFNGIKSSANNNELEKADITYNEEEQTVKVRANSYRFSNGVQEHFTIRNNSCSYSDYHDSDRFTIEPTNQHFIPAIKSIIKGSQRTIKLYSNKNTKGDTNFYDFQIERAKEALEQARTALLINIEEYKEKQQNAAIRVKTAIFNGVIDSSNKENEYLKLTTKLSKQEIKALITILEDEDLGYYLNHENKIKLNPLSRPAPKRPIIKLNPLSRPAPKRSIIKHEILNNNIIGSIVNAKFAHGNKRETLKEYKVQHGFSFESCKVEAFHKLDAKAWETLTASFMDYNDLYAKKGGNCEDGILVTLIQNEATGEIIAIDPQGHEYARYVGYDVELPAKPTPPKKKKLTDIEKRAIKATEALKNSSTLTKNFNSIPPIEMRTALKTIGCRWAPRAKAWQLHLKEYNYTKAIEAVQSITNKEGKI